MTTELYDLIVGGIAIGLVFEVLDVVFDGLIFIYLVIIGKGVAVR